jgi:hypothetical protein
MCLLCLGEYLFPASDLSGNTHAESWASVNIEYGSFFKNPVDTSITNDNQFGSFGVGFAFYSILNWSNFGYFLHGYLLFPDATISKKYGGMITTEEKMETAIGILLGPVYRIMLQSDAYLYLAIGFHIRYYSGKYTSEVSAGSTIPYDLTGFNLGAGGDFGFRYSMSEIFHLNFGLSWLVDIYGLVQIKDPSRVVPKYSWIAVQPYFGLGVAIVSDSSWYLHIGNDYY